MLLPAQSIGNTSVRSNSANTLGQLWLWRFAKVIAATALLAISAHVSISLPFTPVPVTMQTFAVVLLGILLGPASSLLVMVMYLLEGAIGLPVFSPHGPGGIAQLAGPSAGYLLSYPFAASLAGSASSFLRRSMLPSLATLTASILAEAVIFTSGMSWLIAFLHLSVLRAFYAGLIPFLPGELIKVALLVGTLAIFQHARRIR